MAPVCGQVEEDRNFTTLSGRDLMLARAEDLLACLSYKLGKLLRICPLHDPRRVMWQYPDLPPHETRFTADDHRPTHPPVVLLVIPSSPHPPSACQAHDSAS